MNNEFDLEKIIQQLSQGETSERKRRMKEGADHGFNYDEEILHQLLLLCQSKAEEFALIGYDKINNKDIWRFFETRYQNGFPSLHRLVNEILGLKITAYMNWATVNAYKGL